MNKIWSLFENLESRLFRGLKLLGPHAEDDPERWEAITIFLFRLAKRSSFSVLEK